VENNKIVSIKRYDHDKPYIIPQEIFYLVRRVYQDFKFEEHFLKFKGSMNLKGCGSLVLTVRCEVHYLHSKVLTKPVLLVDEDGELVDLKVTDNVSFQFDKGLTQFYVYVFTSKEDGKKLHISGQVFLQFNN